VASRCPDPEQFAVLADGALEGEALATLEDHLASCPSCAEVAAEMARHGRSGSAAAVPWLVAGDRVDRYVIEEWLGSGGMGEVYAALDPQLGRQVAVKLPRGGAHAADRARLLHEAQAMARLTHPNVVSVFDAGVTEERAYIVMELVRGRSLAEWARAERSWREILARYRDAGRGLAAAHRAGLLHRDFKPTNALVDGDGRVLVTDFGLAIGEGIEAADGEQRALTPDDPIVTATGAVVGTPAYMAPEQHRGAAASARSDQFSFCVALYEALYGCRPFAGRAPAEIAEAIEAGAPAPPPHRAPAALFRVLGRGLDADPSRRWRTMDELLGALEGAGRRPRRIAAAAAIAVAAVAGLAGFWSLSDDPAAEAEAAAARCVDDETAIEGAWSPARKAEIAAAFAAIDRPHATENWRRIAATLDGYVARYRDGREQACRATHLERTQSPELLRERLACLADRLSSLEALAGNLPDAAAETLDLYAGLAHRLPLIAECSATGVLGRIVEPPDDEATVEELRHRLRQVSLATRLGKHEEALAELERIAGAATALAYPPLAAEIELSRAVNHRLRKDFAAARRSATAALTAAQASSYRRVAASASIELANLALEDKDATSDEIARLIDLARASVEPLKEHTSLASDIAWLDGELAGRRGDPRAQLAAFQRMAEVEEQIYGPSSPALARSLVRVASVQTQLGDPAQAIAPLEKGSAILLEALGPQHRHSMAARLNLASTYLMAERYDDGIEILREQLAVRGAVFGESAPEVASIRQNLAAAYSVTGNKKAAITEARWVVAALTASLGGDHPKVADARLNLGLFLFADHQNEAAIAEIEAALEVIEGTLGAKHPRVAHALLNLGQALQGAERHREAAVALARAYRLAAAGLGPDHPTTVSSLSELGRARVAAGDRRRGRADLEEALRRSDKLSAFGRAQLHMWLAQALVSGGGDRDRARALAETARELAADRGDEVRAEIDAFLADLD
jgi:predicted Ser/Thr protein kinase